MKYYIAHPAPIAQHKAKIESILGTRGTIHENNNQVLVIESHLDEEALEDLLDECELNLIIVNHELNNWI